MDQSCKCCEGLLNNITKYAPFCSEECQTFGQKPDFVIKHGNPNAKPSLPREIREMVKKWNNYNNMSTSQRASELALLWARERERELKSRDEMNKIWELNLSNKQKGLPLVDYPPAYVCQVEFPANVLPKPTNTSSVEKQIRPKCKYGFIHEEHASYEADGTTDKIPFVDCVRRHPYRLVPKPKHKEEAQFFQTCGDVSPKVSYGMMLKEQTTLPSMKFRSEPLVINTF